MKLNIFVYISIIFSLFCVQFDYLVTLAMAKVYGEIFYSHLEANILVQQTRNINVIFIPIIMFLLSYILCLIIFRKFANQNPKDVKLIVDGVFIAEFLLVGACHLWGGLSWFLSGRF